MFKCGPRLKEESCNDACLVIYNPACRVGLLNLHAMFVREKLKTLCLLSNWIQQSIQKNDGSGERVAELPRSTRNKAAINY